LAVSNTTAATSPGIPEGSSKEVSSSIPLFLRSVSVGHGDGLYKALHPDLPISVYLSSLLYTGRTPTYDLLVYLDGIPPGLGGPLTSLFYNNLGRLPFVVLRSYPFINSLLRFTVAGIVTILQSAVNLFTTTRMIEHCTTLGVF